MILFYDTETTGLPNRGLPLTDPSQPKIVQLCAILDFGEDEEAMRLDVILRQDHVPEESTKTHGITTEISHRIGVTEVLAVELFLDMIAVADMVVGHNIKNFDNGIMTGTVRRVLKDPTIDPFHNKSLFDTMLAGKSVCKLPSRQGGFKNPKLTELHKILFGEEFGGAHQAVNDVLATRRCFYKLQEMVGGGSG